MKGLGRPPDENLVELVVNKFTHVVRVDAPESNGKIAYPTIGL